MPAPRPSCLSIDRRTPVSAPTMEAIQEIASYARARRLDGADELLTEIMAILSRGIETPPLRRQISSEGRAMKVLRFLCDPRNTRSMVREAEKHPS